MLLQGFEGGVVVRLVGDFAYELGVNDVAVGVDDDDRTGEQTLENRVGQRDAVVHPEGRGPERTGRHDVRQALGAAESTLGERKISGNAYHHGVFQRGSGGVEFAHARGAGRGVHTREDVQHDLLAGEVGVGQKGQIPFDQRKARSGGADCGKFTRSVGGVAAKGHDAHEGSLSRGGRKRTDQSIRSPFPREHA